MMITNTLIIAILFIIGSFNAVAQQSISGSFNSNGLERFYTGALPDNPETPLRLVILLHGTQENFYSMEARGFDEFLGTNTMVVYPNAINRMAGFTGTDTVDDFQMVEDLIAHFDSSYSIDTGDICVGGFSSGGAFTYNLVCDFNSPNSSRAYQFKAFAVVSGFVDTNYMASCPILEQVPLIAFHGTADQVVSYDGGALAFLNNVPAEPAETIVDFWATNVNGCAPNPTQTTLPDTVTEQFGNSYPERLEYDCPCNTNSQFYRIVDGLHAWPQGQAQTDQFQDANLDISASQLIADFFNYKTCDDVEDPTGISNSEDNLLAHSLSIYPNPASNQLFIEGDEAAISLKIYSLKGKLVLAEEMPTTHVNVDRLNPGSYFLKISTGSGVITRIFIKE